MWLYLYAKVRSVDCSNICVTELRVSDHGPYAPLTNLNEHGVSARDHARACLTLDIPSTLVLVSFSQVSISIAAYSWTPHNAWRRGVSESADP